MADFKPRQFVNGAIIRSFINKPVSMFVKVDSVDSSGMSLKGQSTDQKAMNIILSEPVNSGVVGQWIETIGSAMSSDTIKCERVITFGEAANDGDGHPQEPFDTDSHNLLVHFLNGDADVVYKMN